MAGKIRHAKLESRTSRKQLQRGRNPHWQSISAGRAHLGYQIWPDDQAGRWILRRNIGGEYHSETIGRADDRDPADGVSILTFAQADAKARTMADVPADKSHNLTVRQAMSLYFSKKEAEGKATRNIETRTAVHILPTLGDLIVDELTAERLRKWLAQMAAMPAQTRPKKGVLQFRDAPTSDDDIRRRRVSANRVLIILKAALNSAYDDGHVKSRDAWGRKLKPFKGVNEARVRYIDFDEVHRLLNACDLDFRPLVRAALETGCRYGELIRLEVQDFNSDAGTLAIRQSKSGKPRQVILTDEGTAFFRQHCAGRTGRMFNRASGEPWKKSDQKRPMRAASERARITPPVHFHMLRHTWASHTVMAGVPLMVVAKNMGHRDTAMVEHYYGHLAPGYMIDAIRAGAPKYGIAVDKTVVPLKG
jgi:integrase